jgi:GT2 family glycosyltransferase
MNKLPLINIVILNWNGYKDTVSCLNSLFKINYPNYNIIVVDNGSKNNEAKKLKKKYKNKITLIENKTNLGFAGGNNSAFKYILEKNKDSEYILIINNDTIVDKNFLKILVENSYKNKNIGISGPMICEYKNNKKTKIISFLPFQNNIFTIIKNKIINKKYIDKNQYKKTNLKNISGCCMLINKQALKKIGPFDKSFFAYVEDTDLCWRYRNKGYKIIWVPQSKIWHKVSNSTGGYLSDISIYLQLRNHLRFAKKIYPNIESFKTISYTFILANYYILYSIKNKRFKTIKLIFHALFKGQKINLKKNKLFKI